MQRVKAGQIRDPVAFSTIDIGARCDIHRLSRPVSGVLPQARQRIEQRTFSHIRIPCQHDIYAVQGSLTSRRAICAASFVRSASRVPLTSKAMGDPPGAV